MRIIGGNDYYDRAMAFGHDPSTVLVRGDKTMSFADFDKAIGAKLPLLAASIQHPPAAKGSRSSNGRFYRSHSVYVIIAGTLYSGLVVEVRGYSSIFPDPLVGTFHLWAAEALDQFLDEHKMVLEEQSSTIFRFRHASAKPGYLPCDAKSYFEPRELPAQVVARLVDQRLTILSHDIADFDGKDHFFRVDQPSLKALEFYRVLAPAVAFQEIEMWKSGVLGSDNPNTVTITDDKVKIAKHGFDHRASFRTAKARA